MYPPARVTGAPTAGRTMPPGPPPGTTITGPGGTGGSSGDIPVLYWTDPLTLETSGCAGATAAYGVTQGLATIRSGSMTEAPPGHYSAVIPAFYPLHGDAQVRISLSCPGGGTPATTTFDIYIDPAGTVVDGSGNPVAGAEVTLLRADTASGPFGAVPAGSAVMSASERRNPQATGADGVFHRDVIPGFYQLQATKAGCHVLGGTDPAALSAVYEVPPPALGITLRLECGSPTGTSGTTLTADPAQATVGQSVVLEAVVRADGAPSGTVAFGQPAGPLTGCTAVPAADGVARCTGGTD